MTEAFAMPPDEYRMPDHYRTTPWTIDEVLALPDNGMRRELLEGRLLESPVPPKSHQMASKRLERLLDDAVPPGLEAIREVNLRIGADLFNPDVMVGDAASLAAPGPFMEAGDVTLVAEILSPGNTAFERAWKPQRYADGGIPFYLEVELGGVPEATAYELRGKGYAKVTDAHAGERLKLAEPFTIDFDPAELVGPRRPA